MRKFSMTTKSQFETLKWALIMVIPVIVTLVWFDFDMIVVIGLVVFLLIYYLPVIYLHYTYRRVNLGEEYIVSHNEVIRIRNGQEDVFTSGDIEKFNIYKSRNMTKKGSPLGMEYYHYVRVILKSGDELVITCLVIPDIDKVIRRLKGVPSELKVRTPCLLKWK